MRVLPWCARFGGNFMITSDSHVDYVNNKRYVLRNKTFLAFICIQIGLIGFREYLRFNAHLLLRFFK